MMFFNITISVVDIFGSGNATSIGKRAIGLYALTTLLGALQGIAVANIFSFLLDSDQGLTDDDDGVKITMKCPKDLGIMTVDADGSMLCVHHNELKSHYNLTAKYVTNVHT
jgi:Na+/H+-dicarboxylate symporter